MQKELSFTNNGKYFISYPKKFVLPFKRISYNQKSKENLNIGFISTGISTSTKKKILMRCRVLSFASKEKKVRNWQGLIIDHRTSFVTLTLPSTQIHEDIEITKEVLGKFLNRCRKLSILQNYVWKAEKQKNGNIHYHILTDSYIDKTLCYRLWLLSLNSLGYVDAYSNKFRAMDLKKYKEQKFNENVKEDIVMKRFWKGNKNNWRLPPCFDTINVSGSKGLENYLAKYISKENGNENLKVNGRSWGCSENVNAGVKLFKEDLDFNEFGFKMAKYVLKKKTIIGDYFEIVKCTLTSIFAWFPKEMNYILEKLRIIIEPCRFHNKGTTSLSFA